MSAFNRLHHGAIIKDIFLSRNVAVLFSLTRLLRPTLLKVIADPENVDSPALYNKAGKQHAHRESSKGQRRDSCGIFHSFNSSNASRVAKVPLA